MVDGEFKSTPVFDRDQVMVANMLNEKAWKAILKLEETLNDLNRVAKESQVTRLLPHMKVEFSLSDIVNSVATVGLFSQIFGFALGV